MSGELMRGGRVRVMAMSDGRVALDGTDPYTRDRFYLDLTPLEAIGLAELLTRAAHAGEVTS